SGVIPALVKLGLKSFHLLNGGGLENFPLFIPRVQRQLCADFVPHFYEGSEGLHRIFGGPFNSLFHRNFPSRWAEPILLRNFVGGLAPPGVSTFRHSCVGFFHY